ncbi:MAG: serine/threonine-protein kinase [Gemmataceae bacterium]
MSDRTAAAGLDYDATHSQWGVLAEHLDALIVAWDLGEPRLADFIPQGPPALRRLVLIELIKVDLEQRISRGVSVRQIESYVNEFRELAADIPCDLIYEEFHTRKRAGQRVSMGEYAARFPHKARELARLLGESETRGSPTVSSAMPMLVFNPGERIEDFDLLTLLGEGAFAKVFLARQRSLQRLVALKVSADRGEEPQTLAQLDHPHIVRVYDQRKLPGSDMRLLYMPYLPGGTLHSVIAHARKVPGTERGGTTLLEAIDRALDSRGEVPPDAALRRRLGKLTWPQAVAWMGARLAEALHYAHCKGVLHRDIKPANVLLGADGSPRLADFNVGYCSKLEGASPAAFFGGSLVYMSPEQLEAYDPSQDRTAADLDGRADLYSLAVTLWELLTGHRPFDDAKPLSLADALTDLTARRRAGVPEAATIDLPNDTPPGLVAALRRALSPNPVDRFADAGEFARRLELCIYPRAESLVEPPRDSWIHTIRRHLPLCMFFVGLIPNALAGAFNYAYNRSEVILAPGATPQLESTFETVQTAINAVCFPLGLSLFVLSARTASRGLKRLRDGVHLSATELAALRHNALRLGLVGVAISVSLWLLAGPVYAIALTTLVAMPSSEIRFVWAHFAASLTVCGMIVAAYPFFIGTTLAVQAVYPAFVRPGEMTVADAADLARVDRWIWPFLILAAAVPLLGVAGLVIAGSRSPLGLGGLCVAGLAGLGVATMLARRIQQTLANLVPAMRLPDEDA